MAIPSPKKPSPFVPHGLQSFFVASAQSTLRCLFLSHFLQKSKRRLHSNRHHRAALAPEKTTQSSITLAFTYL